MHRADSHQHLCSGSNLSPGREMHLPKHLTQLSCRVCCLSRKQRWAAGKSISGAGYLYQAVRNRRGRLIMVRYNIIAVYPTALESLPQTRLPLYASVFVLASFCSVWVFAMESRGQHLLGRCSTQNRTHSPCLMPSF